MRGRIGGQEFKVLELEEGFGSRLRFALRNVQGRQQPLAEPKLLNYHDGHVQVGSGIYCLP